jgi:hypothetical protein
VRFEKFTALVSEGGARSAAVVNKTKAVAKRTRKVAAGAHPVSIASSVPAVWFVITTLVLARCFVGIDRVRARASAVRDSRRRKFHRQAPSVSLAEPS